MFIKFKNYIRLFIWQCKADQKQLQKKFKHAADFGISGNCNPEHIEKFQKAIFQHRIHIETIVIHGTYKGYSVKHYYNKLTKVNVICKDKKFLSGWQLSAMQEHYLLTTRNLA